MSDGLKIFTCGVCMGITKEVCEKWNEVHPEIPAEFRPGGSVALAQAVANGEDCDVIILADVSNFKDILLPDYINDYIVFAANSMALVASEGYEINSENWKEKLLAPDATFFHMNPYNDPGGYRAVMAMMLADKFEPRLSDKLLNHPGHIGMNPTQKFEDHPSFKYMFTYLSGAKMSGKPYAKLPDIMNQSRPELADVYATVSFRCDKDTSVVCTPILHGLAIPKNTKHKTLADEFVKMYLSFDFESKGFSKI